MCVLLISVSSEYANLAIAISVDIAFIVNLIVLVCGDISFPSKSITTGMAIVYFLLCVLLGIDS